MSKPTRDNHAWDPRLWEDIVAAAVEQGRGGTIGAIVVPWDEQAKAWPDIGGLTESPVPLRFDSTSDAEATPPSMFRGGDEWVTVTA